MKPVNVQQIRDMLQVGIPLMDKVISFLRLSIPKDGSSPYFQIGPENGSVFFNADAITSDTYFQSQQEVLRIDYMEILHGLSGIDVLPPPSIQSRLSNAFQSYDNPAEALLGCEMLDRILFTLCSRIFEAYCSKINVLDRSETGLPSAIFARLANKQLKDRPIVVRDSSGAAIAGHFESIAVNQGMFGLHIHLNLSCWVWTGHGFLRKTTTLPLPSIGLIHELSDFGIRRLDELSGEEQKVFLDRGRRYTEVVRRPVCGMVDGFLLYVEEDDYMGELKQLPISGKFMSDTLGMVANDPGAEGTMSFGLGDTSNQEAHTKNSIPEIPEEELMFTDAYLYGMSMNERRWGKVMLDRFEIFKYSRESFDDLILPAATKDLVLSMIQQGIPSLDSVHGKGHARVFLLSGPPGCGKTMTAEACSDLLARPLYSITVGELGTSADDVEEALIKVSKLAERWNAVVLLDEVDIFAAKRATHTIESNAITAVFLRVLERFNGVLFMTTNLKSGIDPAFLSRCLLNLEYKPLDRIQRRKIWINLLHKATREGLTVDPGCHKLLPRLSRMRINGREIKNLVRVFYASAIHNHEGILRSQTIRQILSIKSR